MRNNKEKASRARIFLFPYSGVGASLYQQYDQEILHGKVLINKQLPISTENKIETIFKLVNLKNLK